MLSYGQVGFVAVSMLFLLQIVTGLNIHRLTQSQDPVQSAAEQEIAHLLQRYPEQQVLDRNKRFPKFLTCETDDDCARLDRPACCAKSVMGPFWVCKALGELNAACNSYSMPHMWGGQRNGHFCPCKQHLACVGHRRGGCDLISDK